MALFFVLRREIAHNEPENSGEDKSDGADDLHRIAPIHRIDEGSKRGLASDGSEHGDSHHQSGHESKLLHREPIGD